MQHDYVEGVRLAGHRAMKHFSLFRWFKDVSITKKLYFTVGIMALLICVELFALYFSLNTLSSVRAYVGGEGLWSKAQKDAMFHLYKYGMSRNNEDYRLIEQFKGSVGRWQGARGAYKNNSRHGSRPTRFPGEAQPSRRC
jgi:hypothetical protein